MSLADRVEALLGPGGSLAARWPRYEDRAGQRRLAHDVAETFERGGVLLAEAPTGVGKSLAYLLPAVLAALERDQRVVVATCTRSLQDQLYERDLPALLQALGASLPCARLKGKQNYLCSRALEVADSRGAEERDVLEALRSWSLADEDGDLDRFPAEDPEAFRRVRGRIAADPASCTGPACRRARECFWVRARRRAGESRLLVVNHALLALSADAEGLLPEIDLLIVDEAHRLEGMLLSQLARSVSRHRIEEALRMVGSRRATRATGLGARVTGLLLPLFDDRLRHETGESVEQLIDRVDHARQDAERLFAAVEPQGARHELYGVRERYRSASELLGRDLEPLEVMLEHCGAFTTTLRRLAARAALTATSGGGGPRLAVADELAAELEHAAAQWQALGADLADLGEAQSRDWVYWRSAGGRGVELHAAPLTVGEHARRLVVGRATATVLTSATLSAGGNFEFTAERLGLGEPFGVPFEAASYPSPFPLERQMRAYVYDPPGTDESEAVAQAVAALAHATGRNQLVLFTAHERLRRVRERLREALGDRRVLLAQEWDGPAARVSERFRELRGAVLLGVQSLWEGVDFPGEMLEVVVVAKLPFAVPDDPLVEARGERLRERGRDPFRDDAVPEAILRFRQGVGRLIRRADDRGVLVVCDPRLARASYRGPFVAALPAPPIVMRDVQSLANDAAAFLGTPPRPEMVASDEPGVRFEPEPPEEADVSAIPEPEESA